MPWSWKNRKVASAGDAVIKERLERTQDPRRTIGDGPNPIDIVRSRKLQQVLRDGLRRVIE